MLGGIFSFVLLSATDLEASLKSQTFSAVHLYNNKGERVAFIGTQEEGQGSAFFFDDEGSLRAQIGSYGSGLEKGQPLFGLHDRRNELRLLQRLSGTKGTPVLVMKDTNGIDNLIIGLEQNSEIPYIMYKKKDGTFANLLEE